MRRPLLFVALALVAAVALVLGIGWSDYRAWRERPIALGDAARDFTVERGWSAARTGRELERAGVIAERHWFELHLRLEGREGGIRAGEYRLEGPMTIDALLETLERGITRQYAHTIVEGSSWRETLARVAAEPLLRDTLGLGGGGSGESGGGEGEVVTAAMIDDAVGERLMSAIGHPGLHPEGQFFADTYRFPRGTSDVDYLARAKATLDAVLAEEWSGRSEGLPLESPYEALILASIVEKETAVAAERPLIAGVFLARLEKGMRLQTDPTVIYGIGPGFDGDIRRRDLVTDTPYNTYTRHGLPPTPIAMVGREAIRAVLHPEPSDALYFVSRGDGTHQFSATLAEHEAAVRKYQLGR